MQKNTYENLSTVIIKRQSHDGRGVAHINGKTTFVFGALPGEEVAINYIKRRAKFDEAVATQILKASSKRRKPLCDFFGTCGGCSLQHMDQTAQINFKQGVLLEQLKHFGKIEAKNILKPLKAEAYAYRRKARYSVRYVVKKQKILVGFRELNQPRYLADIDHCEVLDPKIGLLIKPLQSFMSLLENKEHIAQIEASVGDNATALIFRHLDTMSENDKNILIKFAQEFNIWLFLQPGGYKTIYKLFPCDQENYLTYNVDKDLTLYFYPCDFTQINYDINLQMIKQAIEYLELNQSDIVLDLFCGIGNFSLAMARLCKSVLGIEGDASMIARASMNALRNKITNADFYHADLNEPHKFNNILSYNKILIDPPRSGARMMVENLCLDNVEIIVYISCNPASLARDAGILAERGFSLTHAGVMDMFTHTEHVEAMAVFKRTTI